MTFTETLFPACERVLYAHSPLAQVICQVRFPSILRIESQTPADFQEKIRHTFPIFERVAGAGGQQIPPEIMRMMGVPEVGASYNFKTENDKYKLALSGGSIALTCDSYTRWEEFEAYLSHALASFNEIYTPSFYTRIGLRYVNLIQRSLIGLEGRSWSELLREELLGEIRLPQWEERTIDARRNIRVLMSHDAGAVFLQHGLAQVEDSPEISYVVDFDFYKETKIEVRDAATVLEKFHERSGRAFRWCISERLHEALGPQQPHD